MQEQEQLLTQWLSGFYDKNPAMLRKMLLSIGIPASGTQRYAAMSIVGDHMWEARKWRQQIQKICEDEGGGKRHIVWCCMPQNANELCAVYTEEDRWQFDHLEEEVFRVSEILKQLFQLSLTFGIGTPVTTPSSVSNSMREARIAADYRMLYGSGQVIAYSSVAARTCVIPQFPENLFKTVLSAFERRAIVEFEQQLNLLFLDFGAQSVEYARVLIHHLLIELYRRMSNEVRMECGLIEVLNAVAACSYLEEINCVVRQFGIRTIEYSADTQNQERRREQMNAVLRLIEEGLSDADLNINAIADKMSLSTNSVRALFKDFGYPSPKDYIQQLRMEKACRLLEETSLTAKEIGKLVGFSDSRYFYVVFKKCTGKTAYAYRAEKQRNSSDTL